MRYLTFCAIWVFFYFAPQLAGSWYDPGFSAYQALISLILLICAYKILGPRWWVEAYSWCCILAMIMNTGDALMDYPVEAYNRYQNAINIAELVCLLVFPPVTWLWIHFRGARPDNSDGPVSRVSHQSLGKRLG